LITGASDDDPSGIATYSQGGAQFGYDMGWTLLFSWAPHVRAKGT
jgi:Mn2+/Fe2+ NRAMP family transporter